MALVSPCPRYQAHAELALLIWLNEDTRYSEISAATLLVFDSRKPQIGFDRAMIEMTPGLPIRRR